MSSRRPVPGRQNKPAYILRVLADRLPEELLQDYFHDISPGQVRKILTDVIKILTPATTEIRPSNPQTRLWQDREKSWKGGLDGQTLQLFTDGASRGNPGEAGAGISILDEQGNELVATGKYLGKCTNNEAEYRALMLGLIKCAEFGSGAIKAHLDSELIVKQILGQYKVKHPNLKSLYEETMKRIADFASVRVSHVRREKNRRADELANKAIDNHLH